jgi:hypothetical protein
MSRKYEAGRFLNYYFGFVVILTAAMALTLLMVTLAGCPTDTVQNVKQVAEPIAEPVAGTVALNQYITLSCATDSADIYYTLDNSEPSSSGTKYAVDNKPQITGTAILKAIAIKAGMTDSTILTAAYTVNISQVASPVVNPGEGAVIFGQTVTLNCDTDGAKIYYTIDAGEPNSDSTLYTTPIPVTASVTIKAIAYKEGMHPSTVLTVSYTVRSATPTVEGPAAGELHFGDDITITLSCTTGDADIYYTLDGSEPSSSGTRYSDIVPVIPKITGPVTLKAIAVKEGIDDSEVLTVEYTVDYMPPAWTFVTAAASTFENWAIRSIAYGDGKYVAVGDNGKMAWSTNGVEWTAVGNSTFDNTSIRGIAYGDGKYVAVGEGGKMAWSTNGTDWTAIPPGITNDRSGDATFGNTMINGITYADDKFVAGGVNGKIAFSGDGKNWTAVTTSQFGTLQITAIAYGNGKFVVVGGGGTIAYASSSDCQTWTKVTATSFPSGLIIWGIAYGDGKFVAVGGGGNMTWSTDLTGWTAVTPGDATSPGDTTFGDSIIYGITYGGGQFVAVGVRSTGTGMAASPDGKTWIRVNSLITVPTIWGIVYGGGKFIAGAGAGAMAWSNGQE